MHRARQLKRAAVPVFHLYKQVICSYNKKITGTNPEGSQNMDELILDHNVDFEYIERLIENARQEAAYEVNTTLINLYWSIGEYVSQKSVKDGWGRSTVKELSQYILSKEPGIRGYSAQNIWRMKQFFETYNDKPELSTLLRANTWSNNLHIMSKTKSDEEKKFYLQLAVKEKYRARELELYHQTT